ncbi:MAG: ABC transporter permease [Candidatus Aminicenantes bacterium]|nr:ABC transporter permease [Candidatus Aminicenantes bacterium]
MNGRIIGTLIKKDVVLFFRDKFFGVMTLLMIVVFIVIFFILPATIRGTIKVGFYVPSFSTFFSKNLMTDGLVIQNMESDEEVRRAVMEKEVQVGISIPGGISALLDSEKPTDIFVYSSSEVPKDIQEMYTVLMNEMVTRMAGKKSPVNWRAVVLGPDLGGSQVPYRNRMIPLFAFMLIITETLGLANLISSEWETGNVQALMVTPLTVIDFFAGKGFTGVGLAFSQAFVFMAVTGGLKQNAFLVITALFLGSILVTGLAFVLASVAKDMMSVLGWGVLVLIVLVLPATAALFPGLFSGWIKVIPSFFLVDILSRAVNYDIGWSGNLKNIFLLGGSGVVCVVFGVFFLKRKIS